ncbi:MAG: hemerythrin domain-containing protein [Burkholderiales bacterium]|nr:hemerythrin domain-containing protein [Burkholderiales bacterium]
MAENEGEEVDFSKPLAAMKSCHARILARCEALEALAARVGERGADEEARRAAADLLRYFDTTARFHREDEEDDLLPRMIAGATMSRGSSLTRLVADIANEHREVERAWTRLRGMLHDIRAGEATLDPLAAGHFVRLYSAHIAMEEASVYPLAEMLLSRGDLAEIAQSMARRRGDQ